MKSKVVFHPAQILLISQITHLDHLIPFNSNSSGTKQTKTNLKQNKQNEKTGAETESNQILKFTKLTTALTLVSLNWLVSHIQGTRNPSNATFHFGYPFFPTTTGHNYLVLKNTWNTTWCGILGSLSARLFFAKYLAEQRHSVVEQSCVMKRLIQKVKQEAGNDLEAKEPEKSLLKAYKQGWNCMLSLEKTPSLWSHPRSMLEVLGG